MGAYRAGADPAIDAAIACHGAVLDYIRQAYDETVSLEEAIAELVGVFGDA
jgi:flagellum-specific ATP synthase